MKKLSLLLLFLSLNVAVAQEPDFSPEVMVGNWMESHSEVIDETHYIYYKRCRYEEKANMFRFGSYGTVTYIPYIRHSQALRRCLSGTINAPVLVKIKYASDVNQLHYFYKNKSEPIKYQLKRIDRDTFMMFKFYD